jgi:hypothetical protein
LAAISIGQREFEQWNLDVSALRCVPSGSKSRHFKRQASQEFWNQRTLDRLAKDPPALAYQLVHRRRGRRTLTMLSLPVPGDESTRF